MDDFGFGFLLGTISGMALICFIAVIASAGTGSSYNELEIELACRQEFNQQIASNSAQVCPTLMNRLEDNDKEK
jgi:hypothetical protein